VRILNFLKSSIQSRSPGLALMLAAGMILLGGALAFAQMSPPSTAKRIDSVSLTPSQQRAVQWTQGRQRSAKPLPTPIAKATPGGAPKPAPTPPSGPRSVGENGASANVGPAERKTGDPDSIPLRWAGKFFFSKSDGDYICSAQFIAPHIILTAAHCMRDDTNGQWYKDFVFALQYQRGQTTQQLTPKCYATWSTWVHAADDDETHWHFDYAMILTEEASKTGNLGWHFNYDVSQYPSAVKIGYPADILEGEVVQMDGGPLTEPEVRPGLVRLEHGNPKNAGGSSGGAWVGNFSPATGPGKNTVISVTSHHVGDETTVSYGPHFDADFKRLMDYVQGGCK
jgi:Trypsin